MFKDFFFYRNRFISGIYVSDYGIGLWITMVYEPGRSARIAVRLKHTRERGTRYKSHTSKPTLGYELQVTKPVLQR